MQLDPSYAPEGYVAVESKTCTGCAFYYKNADFCMTLEKSCANHRRPDGKTVYFIKKDTP